MSKWKQFRDWISGRADRDLEREVSAHLECEASEQQEDGLPAAQAQFAAQRAFGNATSIKEETRLMWGWSFWEHLAQDFRYALRTMRKSPSFSAVAILSLALGIGANTAIFTFVNAALLKSLPYPNSDRIVALQQRPIKGGDATAVHPRSFVPWQDSAKSFEALAIAQSIPVNTQGFDGAEQVPGLWATPELFRIFGVQPFLGRLFTDEKALDRSAIQGTRPGANADVVLSHGYWQRRFGSDTAIIGKTFPIERNTAVIVGVLPPGFRLGSQDIDIYLPLPLDRNNPNAIGSRSFQCYGLLQPGITIETARAEMAVIADQVGRQDSIEKDWGVVVLGLRDYLVRDNRLVLFVLLAVVVFVLLIACANLAGLLLTRGIGRRNELALRASLGAGRGRLLQQLLVESVALAALGGALGLFIGVFTSRALVLLAKDAVAFGQMADVDLDGRVLAFTSLLSLITAILFGLVPAWQASRFDLHTSLREHGRTASDNRSQQRLRGLFVVGEVALAAMLLIGAGLLLRTFSHLLQVRLGFQPENVVTMRTLVMGDPARRSSLVQEIVDRVQTLPEVRAAGTISFLPLSGFNNDWVFRFVGQPDPVEIRSMHPQGSRVSPGYFATMGIPILRGRDFGRQDNLNGPPVALVNESFVRRYSANADPIGRQIVGDWTDAKPTEIVGVVGDTRHSGLAQEPWPTIFLPQAQSPSYYNYLVVRTAADPQMLAASIRNEVREIDPAQPLSAVQPMEQYVSEALARPRLYAVLVGTFASLALLLAAVGLYGLMAYSVSRRTHEIGIRIALGAKQTQVLGSILGRAASLTVAGVVLGLGSAMALTRFVANLLYGVSTSDLTTYAAVAALLGCVALAASYLPARRASQLDPMTALRHE